MSETATNPSVHLTSGRLLARNTFWNILGIGSPMLVAVVCIPILIRGLGKDRFGVLTLAWALIGYASLFELGLGRALTQLVASKLGARKTEDIPALAWTSLLLMLMLGVVGTISIAVISPWLVSRGLNVPAALHNETLQAFRVLALSIPFVITTAGLRGLLEAHQRFGLINALRIPMGIFTFAGPLLVLPFSHSLVPVVATLVVGRIIAWVAHLLLCLRVIPELGHMIAWERSSIGPLLRFGGWMTVSNIIGPLMVTLDRFVIGALVSLTAVAYYATPYEMVTKVWIIPGALMSVVFPAFSASFTHDPERTSLLFGRSVKTLSLVMFPIVLCIIALAEEILKLWLGADFAHNSFRVLQWLAVGVYVNSLALVPFNLLHGVGRPDVTALLHLIELPLYLVSLWWLIRGHGIEGAAIAWSGRIAMDAVLLFAMARRVLPGKHSVDMRTLLLPVLTLGVLGLATFLQGPAVRGVFLLATIMAFVFITWSMVLTPEERALAQGYGKSLRF